MGKTILVIEDTELLRRMYSDRLEQEGYRVLTAPDGAEALTILRSNAPDLILLDLLMPRMSGLEVLDLIKQDPRRRDIPVIILSNLGQEEDIKRGIEMGAIDYLIKNDVRPLDVTARIAEALREPVASDQSPELHAPDSSYGRSTYQLSVRDHQGDADQLVSDSSLARRFWCPACEVELVLELVPKDDASGWFDARLMCPRCCRQY